MGGGGAGYKTKMNAAHSSLLTLFFFEFVLPAPGQSYSLSAYLSKVTSNCNILLASMLVRCLVRIECTKHFYLYLLTVISFEFDASE